MDRTLLEVSDACKGEIDNLFMAGCLASCLVYLSDCFAVRGRLSNYLSSMSLWSDTYYVCPTRLQSTLSLVG